MVIQRTLSQLSTSVQQQQINGPLFERNLDFSNFRSGSIASHIVGLYMFSWSMLVSKAQIKSEENRRFYFTLWSGSSIMNWMV